MSVKQQLEYSSAVVKTCWWFLCGNVHGEHLPPEIVKEKGESVTVVTVTIMHQWK